MQVKAMYENGTVHFLQPVRLKHRKFEILINIPDEEIETRSIPNPLDVMLAETPADAWLQQMKSTLTAAQLKPDHEIPEPTQKQLDRIEAFSFRGDR